MNYYRKRRYHASCPSVQSVSSICNGDNKKDVYTSSDLLSREHAYYLYLIRKNLDHILSHSRNDLKNKLEFVRVFRSQGVQGHVGFLKLKGNIIVFKISSDMNFMIEHEHRVLEALNPSRTYLPHFLTTFGMIELPVSKEFIKRPQENNLLLHHSNDEVIPRSILLLEYINKLPFYRLTRRCKNKNIIVSQILQTLFALEIAQSKVKFTHYDLHVGNILIQKCEIDSVFLYCYQNTYYCVPTFGFIPIIIDTGISYCQNVNGNFMGTSTYNNDHGFQTTEPDPNNDVHHFLIHLFYELEVHNDGYDSMSNKIKYIFRHYPIMRKSGWKTLPYNPSKMVLRKIDNTCDSFTRKIFREHKESLLEILNGLIILPLRDSVDSVLGECLSVFLEEIYGFESLNINNSRNILYIVREAIISINLFRTRYLATEKTEIILKDFEFHLTSRLEKADIYPQDVCFEKLMAAGILIGERLSTNYYHWIHGNSLIVQQAYRKTVVKTPLDMFIYFARNFTPMTEINEKTKVYYWECDSEKSSSCLCTDLSSQILYDLKTSSFLNRGNILYEACKSLL
jgi:hypothetical protein